MGDIQVQKTESGWIFTKTDGDKKSQMSLEDTNKNGKPDDSVLSILSTDAGKITPEEYEKAKNSIFTSAGSTCSTEEWTAASKKEEALSKNTEDQKAIQYNDQLRKQRLNQALHGNTSYNGTQPSKKKSFWSKFAMGAMIGLGALNVAMPLISRPWQSNGGNFYDFQGTMFTVMTNLMQTMSGFMMMKFAKQGNQMSMNTGAYQNYSAPQNNGMPSWNDFTKANEAYEKNRQEQIEEYNKQSKEEQETREVKQKEEAEKLKQKQAAETIESLLSQIKEEDCPALDSNKAYLDKIYKVGKKYSDEELQNAELITKYPGIPFDTLSAKGEQGKLDVNNTQTAEIIDSLDRALQNYKNDNDAEQLNKSEYRLILNKLELAKQGKLSEEDLGIIQDIVTDYNKRNPKTKK